MCLNITNGFPSYFNCTTLANTISHYGSTQRCAAIFPVGGMKHSQDDPRRSLRPPDGGRDDLLGEVMRKKRHRPDPSGSKQELSRLAGSG